MIPLNTNANEINNRIDAIELLNPRNSIIWYKYSLIFPSNSSGLFPLSIDCNKGRSIIIPIPSRNDEINPKKIYQIHSITKIKLVHL